MKVTFLWICVQNFGWNLLYRIRRSDIPARYAGTLCICNVRVGLPSTKADRYYDIFIMSRIIVLCE